MKVGLFGGSFNPAHEGHAHVAETAMRRLGLDRVVWLVSPQNPLKDARHSAPLAQRMASARLQAHGPSMVVSDFETRARVVWTVDTLRLLVARRDDEVLQRRAFQVVHHHVNGFIFAKKIQHAHHRGVGDLGQRAAFFEKAFETEAVKRQFLGRHDRREFTGCA